MSNTYANHEGGTQQRNSAHLIEFLAASAAFDFANKHHEGPTVNKELGLKENHRTIHMDSFYDELTAMLRMPLTQFMMVSNCLHDKFDFVSKKTLLPTTATSTKPSITPPSCRTSGRSSMNTACGSPR